MDNVNTVTKGSTHLGGYIADNVNTVTEGSTHLGGLHECITVTFEMFFFFFSFFFTFFRYTVINRLNFLIV